MDNGFSFASVLLSYFLVGGGMFAATLAGNELHLSGELAGYGVLAAGAFVGGFFAGRASRGQTIIEPAIGAVAVVATIVGLAATTPIGKLIWAMAQDQTIKFVAAVGLSGIVGAIGGAYLSEKLFGEATRSSIPWALYTAMSAFGASLLVTLFASIVVMTKNAEAVSSEELGTILLIGIGSGCLVAGLAVGSSARVRPLIAAFLGGGAGIAGYFLLVMRSSPPSGDSDAVTGMAVLAVGGAIITLIGTAVGWGVVGRRYAS